MLKHIVMWQFLPEAQGCTKEENMDKVIAMLTALPPIIPQLKSLEIGKDVLHGDMSFDMALICRFESIEDMNIYKNHPEHKKVSAFVKSVRAARCCVDFFEN